MQHDPATVGASEPGHSDLVDVTLQDGKYTIRQVPGGRWECLRYGEPWPAFEGRQPDNLHTALAYEVDHLRDRVDGLSNDLDAAVEVAFRHGAIDWVRMNYPTHFERLRSASPAPSTQVLPQPAERRLSAEDVQWVTNDIAELGVKIGNQFFFLYKGESLVYGALDSDPTIPPVHDDGTPMHWRPIYKREFGECVHPINYENPKLIGKVSLDDSDQWEVLPAAHQVTTPSPQPGAEPSPLESRESAHAGLAPAPGAEATAGNDAGGTAAFTDLLRAAQETVEFFEGSTDPELLPNEHVTIQKLRASVSRAKGGPTVTEVFWALYSALREFADPLDTIADSLKKAPADHPSHSVATIRVKCSDCGKISKIIEVGVDPDTGFVGCEACESTEQLIMLKVGEV